MKISCVSRLKGIWTKWWFSSGGVFYEQTGPHEAKIVSLESQNIPRGHLDINIRKYRVYLGQKEFGRDGGFRREGSSRRRRVPMR